MKITARVSLLVAATVALLSLAWYLQWRDADHRHDNRLMLARLESRWLALQSEFNQSTDALSDNITSGDPDTPHPASAGRVHQRIGASGAALLHLRQLQLDLASLGAQFTGHNETEADDEGIELARRFADHHTRLTVALQEFQEAWARIARLAESDPAAAAGLVHTDLQPRLLASVIPAVHALQAGVQQMVDAELGEIRAEETAARRLHLGLAAGVLLLLGLLLVVLYTDVFRPLLRLEQTARRIGAHDRQLRFDYHRNDELGTMARAFDEMLDALQASTVSRDELARQVASRTTELNLLSLVATHTSNLVVITDAAGHIQSVNAGFERVTGYTLDEVRGRRPGTFLQGPATDPATTRLIGDHVRAGRPVSTEILNYTKAGRAYWLQLDIQPIRDPAGTIIHFIAIESDITERKAAASELENYQRRLDLALDASNTCTFDFDLEGGQVALDSRWSVMLGGVAVETRIPARQLLDRAHPDDRRTALEHISACRHGRRQDYRIEYRLRDYQGRWRWIHSNGRALARDARGRATRIIGTNTDITSRKLAELAVARQVSCLGVLNQITFSALEHRALPELLQNLITHASILLEAPCGELWLKEGDTFVIRAHTRNLAHRAGHRADRTEAPLTWQAHDTRLPVVINDCYRRPGHPTGLVAIVEIPLLVGGDCLGVMALGRQALTQPFTDDEVQLGLLLARLAALTVTNTRSYAEIVVAAEAKTAALRESEAQFRSVFHESPIPIVLFNQAGGALLEVNPAAERIFGWSRAEVLGRTTLDLALWEDPAAREHYLAEIQLQGHLTETEMRLRNKSGEVLTLLSSVRIVQIGGRQCLLNFMVDVTAQKQAEAALRASEARFRALADVAPVGIFSTDAAGRTTFVNHRWCELAGLHPDQALAENWLSAVHPEDRPAILRHWEEEVRSGTPFSAEFRFLRADASHTFLVGNIRPQYDARGALSGHVGTITDITSLRSAEEARRNTEAQLRQAQKMESLGTLAGGIAHDFNNILTGIFGFAELARLELPARHAAGPWLDHLTGTAQRARELVKQILTFGRKNEGQVAPLHLPRVLTEALGLLRATLPAMIELRQEIDPACPPVMADGSQIHQVVLNLCTNALHALPERNGLISVTLAARTLPAGRVPGLAGGHYAVLTVRDNGHGMTPATLERIFEPFFTTKEAGKGTGLGLAVVHGIIESHGGVITVNSTPGAGAVFDVYLPTLTLSGPPPDAATPGAIWPRGNHQRILFVDDDAAAGRALSGLIRALGYDVTVYHDPREALAAFQASPDAFDLVVTDLAMPGLPGNLLANHLTALRPDLPVLLVSGYIEPSRHAQLKADGIKAILPKPPSMEDLAHHLARALPSPLATPELAMAAQP